MGSVFISYSSKDRDRVAVIADTLRIVGFDVTRCEVVAGRAIGQAAERDGAMWVLLPASEK